ncbi:peptidase M16 [Luteimonas chenhongjianii]|uniref:Peptidase M16 n=1 Tax=Luteimonas chenhongjianii TaxID=2006110 RepID=A0A290XHE2_9GAMM|nr:pitrilysin family protein [Luteimonas chenhongjianii]ATD68582.1 peptidase M16 [Luteimonas chenhongjianii]
MKLSLVRNCALVLFLSLHASALANVPALPASIATSPCVEGICEYHLENGLRVLLFPDATKPTVTVNLVYGVGSVHENYGETGMAHLLEHLLFKGTPAQADIPGEMKKRGIGYNATTGLDRTNYFASFPADDATLDWMLALEADRMVNSRIAQADLDSEMTVVRNELEAGENNPAGVLLQRVRSVAFDWHNYGNLPIGARSDVEGVPLANLRAFYARHYQPDNALLVVAGRIDAATVLPRIEAHFAPLAKPARTLPGFHTAENPQDGEREVTVRRAGDLQVVAAVYHTPALAHPDNAALAVLANVLGDTPRGRVHKALVETKLAAVGGAGSEGMRDPGLFSLIAALPGDGDGAAVEAELLRQAERIAEHPVSEQEVAEARQRLANATERLLTDVNAVGMALSESQAAGDWRLLFVQRDAVARVTAADVNRVAAAYLKPSNRTLGRFVPTLQPDRAVIAAAPAVATLVDGYVGQAAVEAGETFDPTPSNIAARAQTFTLGDGLRVSLLPKTTRGGTVVVDATFRFGDENAITGRTDAGGWVAPMLMLGSTSLSREQIATRFDALRTQAQIGGSAQSVQLKLLGRRDTVADALALAADVLRNPAFPESEFEQLRLQAVTGLEFQRSEPGAVAGIALARHFDPWPKGHPLHVDDLDTSLAKIRAMTLDDVRAYHADIYGTSIGEIAIVGDFDADAVRAQLETLFAGWKADVDYAPIRSRYTDVNAERASFSTPDKPNAVVLARHNLSLNLMDEDFIALSIANVILGGDPLKARLGDRLRQRDGLTYGVTSGLSEDNSREGRDDNGHLVIQAIAAPQNVAKAEAAIREEFARLVQGGVTEQEVRDAVSGRLVARRNGRGEDAVVAGIATKHLQFGRDWAFEAARDAAYEALTAEQVNAAIRKHFRPDNLSVFVAGDFKE